MPPDRGVERIAVLRANALGDLVFTLPALDALRAAYPAAEIVLLGREWHAALLSGRPGPVDRVAVAGETPEHLAGESWDLALQMHGGGAWSNPYVSGLGARVTAGCRDVDAPALDRCIPYVYYQPEVSRWLEVAGLVGAPPVTLEPRLAVTDADRETATLAVGEDGPLAVLHPGASDPRRRWPASSFAALGDALATRGLRVALTGVEEERGLVAEVAMGMAAPALDLAGALSLGGLVGLLERAEVVVANDTGPLHVAGAVGTPSVGVYWIGNLVNGGPLVRARHRPLPDFRVACPVCGVDCTRGECGHDASFVAGVTVAEAEAACHTLLAYAAPAPA